MTLIMILYYYLTDLLFVKPNKCLMHFVKKMKKHLLNECGDIKLIYNCLYVCLF